LHQPAADLLAIFDGTGLDHELGETGGRQLLIQRQVEARGAGAYVGDKVLDARVIAQPLLQTSGLCLGRLERGALGQGQVDHQLEATRGWEELLGDQPERQQRTDEQDRKSTRLNSSHVKISYAVFCLKKKKK